MGFTRLRRPLGTVMPLPFSTKIGSQVYRSDHASMSHGKVLEGTPMEHWTVVVKKYISVIINDADISALSSISSCT